MLRATILQHVEFEGPGLIGDILTDLGFVLDVRHLYCGDAVPVLDSCGKIIVVMGGSMGVGDTSDSRFPFLNEEIELLRLALATNHPVLGICLGAQLLANAAGAAVYPNICDVAPNQQKHVREVGWAAVDFNDIQSQRVLSGLQPREMMLHWHGDTFDMPDGAVVFASTPWCSHQAFHIHERQFGLQFHCEVDASTIANWVNEDGEFVALANGPNGGSNILADTKIWMPRHRVVGERLLRNIFSLMNLSY